MSGSSKKPRSDDPNTPLFSCPMYLVSQNVYFAGNFLGAIFYGIAIILLFQNMGAFLNPIDRTRWGIRPLYFKSTDIIPNLMLFLNTCLADGFLLYRCYVMNSMVIVLPCLSYITSLAFWIVITYHQTSATINGDFVRDLGMAYFSVSLCLDVLLTLIIATRLIRHSKNIRDVTGSATDNGLYNTIVTIFFESCTLYAFGSVPFIGSLVTQGQIQGIFANVQARVVIAPFLVILRVANRTALTSNIITSGNIGSIRFRSRGESAGSNGTLPDESTVSPTGTREETPCELGPRIQWA